MAVSQIDRKTCPQWSQRWSHQIDGVGLVGESVGFALRRWRWALVALCPPMGMVALAAYLT